MDAGWSAGAVVLIRVGLAALVVAPFGLRALRGQWHLLRRNAGLIAGYGVLAVAGAQFCYFSAVGHMQVGPALLIEYTAPAAVVVWLWLRHGQRPGPITLVGAGLAALGLVLVLDLLSGADLSLPGVLWALAAMVGARVVLPDLRRRVQRSAAADAGRRRAGRRHRRARRSSGLVGLMPMRATTASVEYAGTTVAWWVPMILLGLVTAGVAYTTGIAAIRRLGLAGRLLRRADRGAGRRGLGLGAARRAAPAGPAARRPADPRRRGRGQARRAHGRGDRAGLRLRTRLRLSATSAAVLARQLCMDVGVTESRPDASDLSFDAWAEARVAALLRFAYLVTGSQHAAEDAVQSALDPRLREVVAGPAGRRPRRLRTPDGRQRARVRLAAFRPPRVAGRRGARLASVDPVDRVAEADAVWRVCSRLPAQQRAVVVLRFYEDLDYDEIAALLGISPVSVRTYVHRALASLRAELTSEEDGDG